MSAEQTKEGTWLEAISLFQQARAGDHLAGMRLVETSAHPSTVVHDLLRMLTVFLRGEEPEKLDRFLEASFRAGPPPLANPFAEVVPADPEVLNNKLRGRATLSAQMRDMLATQLPILATVTEARLPDVGPKRSLRAWDEHALVYNESTAGQHLANIRAGSKAVIAVVDRDALDGYRFVGTPEVHEDGAVFDAAASYAIEHGLARPAAAVLIRVEQIHTLKPGPKVGARIA